MYSITFPLSITSSTHPLTPEQEAKTMYKEALVTCTRSYGKGNSKREALICHNLACVAKLNHALKEEATVYGHRAVRVAAAMYGASHAKTQHYIASWGAPKGFELATPTKKKKRRRTSANSPALPPKKPPLSPTLPQKNRKDVTKSISFENPPSTPPKPKGRGKRGSLLGRFGKKKEGGAI